MNKNTKQTRTPLKPARTWLYAFTALLTTLLAIPWFFLLDQMKIQWQPVIAKELAHALT